MSKSFQPANHPCLGSGVEDDKSLENTIPSGCIFTH